MAHRPHNPGPRRGHGGILFCFLCLSLGVPAGGAAAREDTIDALPVRPPDRVFTYPGDTRILDLAIAPDGGHVYAVMRIGTVNLWAVAVYRWPEIALVVAIAVPAIALWRLLRRRQAIGQPHCRRCNYLLVDGGSLTCPECGIELSPRNRVIGPRYRQPSCLDRLHELRGRPSATFETAP